jgi:hypothetical protein
LWAVIWGVTYVAFPSAGLAQKDLRRIAGGAGRADVFELREMGPNNKENSKFKGIVKAKRTFWELKPDGELMIQ